MKFNLSNGLAAIGTALGILKVEPSSRFARACALGKGYVFQGSNVDIDVNDTLLLIKNLIGEILYFERAMIAPANVVTELDFGFGNKTTTLAGTEITGRVVGHPGESVSGLVDCYSDETALTDADLMFTAWGSIVNTEEVDLSGLYCKKGAYLQINNEIETTSGNIAVFCYHSDEAP